MDRVDGTGEHKQHGQFLQAVRQVGQGPGRALVRQVHVVDVQQDRALRRGAGQRVEQGAGGTVVRLRRPQVGVRRQAVQLFQEAGAHITLRLAGVDADDVAARGPGVIGEGGDDGGPAAGDGTAHQHDPAGPFRLHLCEKTGQPPDFMPPNHGSLHPSRTARVGRKVDVLVVGL
ncbi:hypothetical protein RM779_17235 [Streptomyces sp. DSM 41886]|uniref:Uncharacterized protein n=1 Tax=Streptomyces johnsoniae TaxID=3075532 RepID=A0ABU2S5S0_9ACTN|nr:hypothetical protein [Streptomyces sp. DSM 41886]